MIFWKKVTFFNENQKISVFKFKFQKLKKIDFGLKKLPFSEKKLYII
jgi:hypothetical protein